MGAVLIPSGLPAGSITKYAGATAPSGWMFCAGQSVLVAGYPALFAAIGYAFGGSGANFNLPDARGRVLIGKDNMGGTAANRLTSGGSGVNGAALGAAGGGETVTLSAAQIASHAHTQTTTNGSVGSQNLEGVAGAGGATTFGQRPNVAPSVTNMSGYISTQAAGSGGAHSNVPPALVVNVIIKI